jgi:hypothetical protein
MKSQIYFFVAFVLMVSINIRAQRAMFGSNNKYVAPVVLVESPFITNGLVFNVDAANTSSYAAGSGNVWNDLNGSNHINFYNSSNYSSSGNPTYSTDGGGSLVTTGLYGRSIANSGISGAAPRSFEGWVKFNTVQQNSIIYIGTNSARQLFEMMAYGSNLISHPYGGFAKSSTVLNTSNWYQVVVTYDGSSNHVIYINGVQVGTSSAGDGSNVTLGTANTPIYIGSGTAMNWGAFDGKIAMLRIYNRALSSSDVKFNFDGLKSRFGL